MPNMKKVISCHNRIVTDANRVQPTNPSMCNCQQKQECPLPSRCLTDKVVYQATVTDENQNRETYTGLTSQTFKERHYKHKNSFKYKDSENSTTLSTHIWDLKDRGVPFSLEWDIIDRAPPFNPTTRKCRLCLKEKYHIMFSREGASLNQRSEIFNTCRHRLRDLLANV